MAPKEATARAVATLSRFFPRRPIDLGDAILPLPDDGSIPGIGEWRWIHTPGHSPGHVSLFRDYDRALVAGDAFVRGILLLSSSSEEKSYNDRLSAAPVTSLWE